MKGGAFSTSCGTAILAVFPRAASPCHFTSLGIVLWALAAVARPSRPWTEEFLPTIPEGKEWKLTWSDEFAGTKIDQSKWEILGDWKRQDGYWVKEDAYLDGKGNLVLRIKKDGDRYTCGAVRTKNKFEHRFGYWLCRCKFPEQPGHWPAFWVHTDSVSKVGEDGRDGTEIDIMEYPWREDITKAELPDYFVVDYVRVYDVVDKAEPPDQQEIIRKVAHVTPSPRQLAWQQREVIAFIHFGINTFTDKEWGTGKEDPKLFNPTQLDARQWVRVCKEAGMKMIILTAKHHDGFCLWPSQYTEHSVKNSPWREGKGDVVRELADACREAGLAMGLYLSPWDMHEPTYGDTVKYNEFYKDQLHELLTNYGEVDEVWFDGAKGPNAKDMEYDWAGYYAIVRELQPNAVIFNGPDVRWVGNESGYARESEWSVMNRNDKPFEFVNLTAKDLGSAKALGDRANLIWYPAEADVSIRPGWFYHASQDDKVKSLEKLLDIYFCSVGRNSVLLLNIPPDRRGLIHENDARRLRELGKVLDEIFKQSFALGAVAKASHVRDDNPIYGADKIVDGNRNTYWCTDDGTTSATVEFSLAKKSTFNVAELAEYIRVGQRVEEFTLEAWDGGHWNEFARSTTVGYKRLLRFDDVTTEKVRLRILMSRLCPTICQFGLYYAQP